MRWLWPVLVLSCGAPRGPSQAATGVVVARVGGEAVTAEEVTVTARAFGLAPREALERAVETRLLAQEARRRRLDPAWVAEAATWRASVQLLLATAVESRYSDATLPPGLVARAVDERTIELAPPERLRVAHFLAPLQGDGALSPAAARAAAERFRASLPAEEVTLEAFEAAAAAFPTPCRVERLDPMDREGRFDADGPSAGRYVQSFVRAAWTLTPEAPVSAVTTTEFGVHVLLRVALLPPEPASPEVLRRVVRWDLVNSAREQGLQELLTSVRVRHRWHLSVESTHRLLGIADAP
ncbi:MAG: hypothetical protein HY909_08945 [Deltaproteobacteria bacterium]|nr:hypothetical protein [Deltaproteobacteria bacterium]